MIAAVIRTQQNMVMVFDEDGEQIPEYQGNYTEVKQALFKRVTGKTVFKHWYGNAPEPVTVRAGEW